MDARSLPSDRAVCMLGRRVSIELGLSVVRLPYSSLSAAELDTCMFPLDNRYLVVRLRFEQDFTARLFVKISLRRLLFRKNVHADFYGLSDIDFVVTDFDPNTASEPAKSKAVRTVTLAGRSLGRYVATALLLELGRDVATERAERSFAT